ncbi:MAG: hypothetical protein KKA84_12155 [Bacteroidetes bacterium]|nr:hypothetical protein [Bacteroidota bacterium]
MAIKKNRKTPQGVDADYHKVSAINIDFVHKKATITIALYISRQARDEGYLPVGYDELTVYDEDFDFSANDKLVEKAYEKLKENDKWKDGEDV